jgi:AbiV family abortive infection protein
MWNRMPKVFVPKIYPHDFSEQELREGSKKCIENTKRLLEGAKTLNENDRTEQFALGLYMYAVEEFGKAILLKKAITGNQKEYQIFGWILGLGKPNERGNAHDEKIKIGLDNLPSDCRTVNVTVSVPFTRTIRIGQDNIISIPESATGTFLDVTNPNKFVYSLDLKTACFYIDWDKTINDWKYDVVTQPDDLKKYIKCLEDALEKGI